ncbi:MAG: hypothetical protein E7273_12170 [Pseudobutyrivibrio ruminis]|nr:hypothetical protein [Pseudobutyrivibrio ruminis]
MYALRNTGLCIILRKVQKMEYTLLYILTIRCDNSKCEEDLELHRITDVDEEKLYLRDGFVYRDKLMKMEIIKENKREIICRVPFVIKEAAIVWVREILMYIRKRGTEAMYYAVNDEWMRILDPRYDVRWFTGGAKVEAWRKEMLEIAAKL